MNRLWVRLSLVIAAVAIFIALSPLLARQLGFGPLGQRQPGERIALPEGVDDIPPERIARLEEAIAARVWRGVWVTIAVGGVVGLGAGIFLSRSLVRPLTELEKGAAAVAARDLAYRVPEKGSRELRAVAHSFNQMAVELEQQERLRRNLLADVTHELRHPVHVLNGNLQGILDGVFPLEETEIGFLMEQTQLLSRLISDLHELALAEADELPLQRQDQDLRDVAQQALDAVQPLAVEKMVALHWQRPVAPLAMRVDAARVRQALQNLLSNAIRYTPGGGTVSLSLVEAAAETVITVHDSGMGIAAADLPHIFDRFYRADHGRDRENGGAGLGLAIARAIVLAHDGRITAASDGPGLGSTFTIYFPPT